MGLEARAADTALEGAASARSVASGVAAQQMADAELASTKAASAQVEGKKAESNADVAGGRAGAGSGAAEAAERPAQPSSGEGALSALPLGDRLEVSAGTNGLFVFSGVSSQISLFAEGRYRFNSFLQMGVSLSYRYQSDGTISDSAFQGLVGPVFNFAIGQFGRSSSGDGGIENAFFVSPKVGATAGRTKFGEVVQRSGTEATVALSIGKRFALSPSVAYAPSVGVVKVFNYLPNFTFQPLSLSVFF
jgi:hypothetical protein